MKKLLVFLLAICGFSQLNATKNCYLLTCDPGEKVYELYGHSALLLLDDKNPEKLYNYGIFSFSEDNFILKFVLGQTYYLLDEDDFYNFMSSRHTEVSLARLCLNEKEYDTLDSLLQENMKAENRRYLYNYFNDNCATRIRDLIEKSVDGRISYPDAEPTTYRQCVKNCVGDTWQMFGIDLLLGAPADTLIHLHEQMFLPLVMEQAFMGARIVRTDGTEKLIQESPAEIPSMTYTSKSSKPFMSPTVCFALILAIVIFITLVDWKKSTTHYSVDFLLFLTCGLAGLIVCFVSFFSIHPTVFPNYIALMMHPLQLLGCISLFCSKRVFRTYIIFNAVMLFAMLIIGLMGIQHFDCGIYLIIAIFATRLPLLLKRN